jgi:hypothetical protein
VAAAHVIGFPAALLVAIRVMVAALSGLRRLLRGAASFARVTTPIDRVPALRPQPPRLDDGASLRPVQYVEPRETFDRRGSTGR